MRRFLTIVSAAVVLGLLVPARSQAQQSLNVYFGGFVLNGYDSRVDDGFSNDVLVNNYDFLIYDIADFHGPTVGAEYLVGLGDMFEAGLGVGYYQGSADAIDADYEYPNGTQVHADLKLRTVPFTATVRFLPLGHRSGIIPYIGGGVTIVNWKYTEVGDFVDVSDYTTFYGKFQGDGVSTGPVILGGLRVPIGAFDFGGEVRYQHAEGELPRDQDFSGDKINLGGWSYLATFNIRF